MSGDVGVAAGREEARMRRRFAVVAGPDLASKGGIASVLATLSRHGMFARDDTRFLATYRDGGKLSKSLTFFMAMARFIGWCFAGRVRVLHVHSAFGASLVRKGILTLVARTFGCPVVFEIHNGAFVERYRDRGMPARWLIERVLLMSSKLLVLTPAQLAFFGGTLRHPAVDLVNNPVEVPGTADRADAAGECRVVFLGALKEEKGAFDLLNAWAKVSTAFPSALLFMYGVGLSEDCRQLATRLGVQDSVKLPGWIEGERKFAALRSAHVVVLPSHSEGLPVTLLEAMAYGRPIIASRVGAIPLLFEGAAPGWMVAPGDVEGLARAMADCLSHPEECLKRGEAGRRRVESEYSVACVANRMLEIYAGFERRSN